MSEEILTVAEAASFAKVPESVIRRWLGDGLRHIITVSTVGRRGPKRQRIRKSELIRYMTAHEEVTAPLAPTAPKIKRPRAVATDGVGWWQHRKAAKAKG